MIGNMDPVTKAWCGGDEAAADTAMNKLLVKNGLKEMSKECARNAYLTKGNIEFQLAANEIKQLLASIVKDVQVALLSSEVTVTVQSTRRRLNGAATTSVEYSAGYANKQEASKFGSNSQVKLDTTQKVAAKNGLDVPSKVSASGKGGVEENPNPTGEKSAEPDASMVDTKAEGNTKGSTSGGGAKSPAASDKADAASHLNGVTGMLFSIGLALLAMA